MLHEFNVKVVAANDGNAVLTGGTIFTAFVSLNLPALVNAGRHLYTRTIIVTGKLTPHYVHRLLLSVGRLEAASWYFSTPTLTPSRQSTCRHSDFTTEFVFAGFHRSWTSSGPCFSG